MKFTAFVLLLASALCAQQVQLDFLVYVGSYDAREAGSVIISLPEGTLTPSYGPSVAEEIQKTFHLKTFDLLAAPRIITEVKMPARIKFGQEPPPGSDRKMVPQEVNMTADVLSMKDGLAHVKLEFSPDGKPATGAEFTAKAGQPVTLSSRLDDHLLFLIFTLNVPDRNAESAPRAITKYTPIYPEDLKKAGVQGVAVLKLRIDEKGRVAKCEKMKADDERFVAPACEAALKWEFEAGKKNGRSAAMDYTVTINFRLD